jgi:hypothetical protein
MQCCALVKAQNKFFLLANLSFAGIFLICKEEGHQNLFETSLFPKYMLP